MESDKVLFFTSRTCAGRTGSDYEIRLSLLFMIKALLNDFESWQLGCNLPENCVGKLDDVVLLYKLKDGIRRAIFVQAKNTKGEGVCLDSLTTDGKRAQFSLTKYFESYKTIKAWPSKESKIEDLNIENVKCVLLTKQGIKDDLKGFVLEKENDDFLEWSLGRSYQLKQKEISDEMKLSNDARKEFASFLDKFTLAVHQPDETQLEGIIKQELAKVISSSPNRCYDVYLQLHEKVSNWYITIVRKSLLTKDQFLEWLITAICPMADPVSGGYNPKYYVERTMQYVTLKDPKSMEQHLLKYTRQHSDGSSYPDFSIKDRSVMGALRHHIDKNKFVQLWESEDQFLREEHRVVIITDSPGMGKSTILTSFFHKLKEIRPEWWIISVDLNSIEIEKHNLEKIDLSELLILAQLSHQFEKLLFVHRIKYTGSIAFMLDGFDEISEDRQKAVINLAKLLLRNSRVKRLFITSRTHLKETLENELGAFAFTLTPFSQNDQIKFLVDYWRDNAENCRDSEAKAEQLVQKLSKSIRDRDECFAGIPLQCRMLAEAYIDLETKDVELPEKLNLVLLYEQFVEKKKKIYDEDKRKLTMTTIKSKKATKNILNSYRIRALKAIFPDCNIKWEDEIETEPVSVADLKRFGLISGMDESFIHQTFAEYFAASSLVKIFENGKHHEFFIETVCIGERLFVLRQFINNLTGDAWKLRAEQLTKFQLIEECLAVCVKEECDNIVRVLIELTRELHNTKKFTADILQSRVNDESVIHLPLESERIEKELLDFAEGFGISANVCQNEEGQTVLHVVPENSNVEFVGMLLSLAKILGISTEVFEKNVCKPSILQIASVKNNKKIVRMLHDLGKELGNFVQVVEAHDQDGNPVTTIRTENGRCVEFNSSKTSSSFLYEDQTTSESQIVNYSVKHRKVNITYMVPNSVKGPETSAHAFKRQDKMNSKLFRCTEVNKERVHFCFLLITALSFFILYVVFGVCYYIYVIFASNL